jgi:hypothetical protein
MGGNSDINRIKKAREVQRTESTRWANKLGSSGHLVNHEGQNLPQPKPENWGEIDHLPGAKSKEFVTSTRESK